MDDASWEALRAAVGDQDHATISRILCGGELQLEATQCAPARTPSQGSACRQSGSRKQSEAGTRSTTPTGAASVGGDTDVDTDTDAGADTLVLKGPRHAWTRRSTSRSESSRSFGQASSSAASATTNDDERDELVDDDFAACEHQSSAQASLWDDILHLEGKKISMLIRSFLGPLEHKTPEHRTACDEAQPLCSGTAALFAQIFPQDDEREADIRHVEDCIHPRAPLLSFDKARSWTREKSRHRAVVRLEGVKDVMVISIGPDKEEKVLAEIPKHGLSTFADLKQALADRFSAEEVAEVKFVMRSQDRLVHHLASERIRTARVLVTGFCPKL